MSIAVRGVPRTTTGTAAPRERCCGGLHGSTPPPAAVQSASVQRKASGGILPRTGGSTVTARVLTILGTFDEQHPRLTLSEIASRARIPVSTAHRLVGELAAGGAVQRDADGRYVIGRTLWRTGTLAPVARELREACLPAMQDLYEATHENVQIAVREGRQALYIERIHGRASVRTISRPGAPVPLHATGVGKMLLAWAPQDVVDACLADLARYTPYTITEPRRMIRELATVRRLGYARTGEEMGYGTRSLAVPVLGPDDAVVAALAMVTRSGRRDLIRFVPALRVAAASITRSMAAR